MAKRILLAGVLGGIALFMWGGLAHMVLGLGMVGIQNLPQPQPVMDALKASTQQSGFYFFPPADAAGKVAPDKVGGPYGIMIYQAAGAGAPMTGQMLTECALDIVMALFAAFVLSLASGLTGFASRVGFVTFLGLMVGLMTNVQYWNWYGFPLNYTEVAVFMDIVGFLIVGLIAAALVKPSAQRITAVPAKAA
ncbi:MAG: hypothetical protein ABSA78_09100 [Candidatus Sulfotelmatobacter sp.]|jgi:hypothetical protein